MTPRYSRSTSSAFAAFLLFTLAFVLAAIGGCINRADRSVPAHCTNATVDSDESDIDCGGSCAKCTGGGACKSGGDCTSNACNANVCAAAAGEPTITSFTADKRHAPVDTIIQLTAVFEGGIGSIDNDVGGVESGTAYPHTLKGPTVFTLTVTSEAGISSTRKVKVDIGVGPAITSFKADRPAVKPGESTTLTAVFTGGKGTIDNDIGPVESGKVVPTGAVNANKHYILTVTSETDPTDKVTEAVDVEAAVTPVITSFSTPSTTVSRFKPATLTAVFTGGKGSVDKGVGAITSGAATPSKEVPFAGETWTLTVTNGLGEAVTKTATVTTKQEIFVADNAMDVLVFDIDDTGDVEPKRIINTDTALIEGIVGLWVDNGEIYVANENKTPAINVFSISSGGRPPYSNDVVFDKPLRTISGAATTVDGPYIFALAGDEIFVADKTSTIKVFAKTANGNVPPKRTLGGPATGIDNALAAYVSGNELYIASDANGGEGASITIFPKDATGDVAPTRTILTPAPTGMRVEGNELFVSSLVGGVTVYDKTTGTQLRQLTGTKTQANQLFECAIAANQLFCAEFQNAKVLIFPQTASGDVAPTRIIAGDKTYLATPTGLFVY